jgi:hypothetical protein
MNGVKAETSFTMPSRQWALGAGTRFGPDWPGQRCGAKTRQGTACGKPALKGRTRCQLHGGRSTGPKTMEGRQRVAAAHFKHGRRTSAQIEADRERARIHRQIWAELCIRVEMMIQDGTLPKNYRP